MPGTFTVFIIFLISVTILKNSHNLLIHAMKAHFELTSNVIALSIAWQETNVLVTLVISNISTGNLCCDGLNDESLLLIGCCVTIT